MSESDGNKGWVGKHKILAAIVGLAIVGVVIAATNNRTVTVTTKTNTATAPTKDEATSSKKAAASDAHVGSTLSLKDQSGYTADVIVVKIIDPAQSTNAYITPEAGKRYVGVQLKITNTSTKATDGYYPNNDVTLVDSKDQAYTSDFADLADCQAFASAGTKLAAGESMLGCVTFQIPETATVAKLKYTPNSGFADNTGVWLVP